MEDQKPLDFEDIGSAVQVYVTKRDDLRAWSKVMAEEETARKAELERIEVWLLQKADSLGVDSFKTPHGTAYKAKSEHYRVGNWDEIVEFIKRTNNFQILEKRIAKLATKEIQEQTGEIPPGITYTAEYVMNVLRPTNRKGKEVSE
jgi:hypothetical protein